jgi:hypothetical protein
MMLNSLKLCRYQQRQQQQQMSLMMSLPLPQVKQQRGHNHHMCLQLLLTEGQSALDKNQEQPTPGGKNSASTRPQGVNLIDLRSRRE